ncbi:hypothetical protein Dimus_036431, partial [Dionaea muscipula]
MRATASTATDPMRFGDMQAQIGRRNKNKEPEKKRRGGGFTKLCSLSPQLQEFVGVPELARTEVVKKLWDYIREKSLQDPGNRQNINSLRITTLKNMWFWI